VRKVNTVVSLYSSQEIDNQVRNPNEPCRYPHQFFQNSASSSSSSPETGSSSEPWNATEGVPNDSDAHLYPNQSSKKEELKEKDSSDSVDPSPFKGSSFSYEKVHMPLPPSLKSKLTFFA